MKITYSLRGALKTPVELTVETDVLPLKGDIIVHKGIEYVIGYRIFEYSEDDIVARIIYVAGALPPEQSPLHPIPKEPSILTFDEL